MRDPSSDVTIMLSYEITYKFRNNVNINAIFPLPMIMIHPHFNEKLIADLILSTLISTDNHLLINYKVNNS